MKVLVRKLLVDTGDHRLTSERGYSRPQRAKEGPTMNGMSSRGVSAYRAGFLPFAHPAIAAGAVVAIAKRRTAATDPSVDRSFIR